MLKVDWNTINNLLISCGEDKRYKVWDQYGRQLYSSTVMDSPVVSLAWNPNGDMFAVGGYNSLRMCDKLGVSSCAETERSKKSDALFVQWCYAHTRTECGSLVSLSWSADGTQLACAGGNGAVLFAHTVDQYAFFCLPISTSTYADRCKEQALRVEAP